MIEKEKIPELIDRYTNHDLTGEELKEFLELLKNDVALRAEVNLDRDLEEILRQQDLLDLRRKIIEASNDSASKGGAMRILLMAAGFLLVAAITVILYLVAGTRDHKSSEQQAAGRNSTLNRIKGTDTTHLLTEKMRNSIPRSDTVASQSNTERRKKDLLADNFKPFPAFESLVGTHVRSGSFLLMSPADSAHIIDQPFITFTWRSGTNTDLVLKIMNNHGTTVFESGPFTASKLEVPTIALNEGLFYFKFMHANQIIHFGKFFLNRKN